MMKAFIQHLIDEHNTITEILSKAETVFLGMTSWTPELLNAFETLIGFIETFMENNHHHKEEELLFPRIDMSPIVYQGGPYCTHYYHFHLEYQRYDQSQELAKETQTTIAPLLLSPAVQQMVDHKNALMVPLEDHWASHNYTQIFKTFLSQAKSGIPIDHLLFRRSFIGFIGLIAQHTEKENNCLFVMCNDFLDDEAQNELLTLSKIEFVYNQAIVESLNAKLNALLNSKRGNE